MRVKMSPYTILHGVCAVCAVGVAIAAWMFVPVKDYHWSAIVGFVVFAALTELLAVDLADESFEVTPSSPIYWAAACVLGPLPSIIVCLAGTLSAESVALVAFWMSRRRAAGLALVPDETHTEGSSLRGQAAGVDWIQHVLGKIGRVWEPKAGTGAFRAIESSINYASLLVLMVGLSGLAYRSLGGTFLIEGMPPGQTLTHFVLPFLGLAAVAISTDVTLYGVAMVVLDPVPGVGGVRGVLLRMHLVLIETALPLIRAQMFLVIVSLMLSYLYVHLGPWGFVLTSLPVVALRDFYYQWVAEQSAYLDTITTLATYMQHYHPYTRGHLKRVADMSERLARELRLPAESIRHISHAGLLHDIGKIGVSEQILDKTAKLEPEEWEKIKEHPSKGAEIISHLDFLEGIVDWIRYHHKWHDGRGYPETNGKSAIPIEASIIAVADSFDAMIDDRELSVDWVCDSCGYKPDNNERPPSVRRVGQPSAAPTDSPRRWTAPWTSFAEAVARSSTRWWLRRFWR
jgi:putative nucleotidyltransferase with HDIG domain